MKTKRKLLNVLTGIVLGVFVATAGLWFGAEQVSAAVTGYPNYRSTPHDPSWYTYNVNTNIKLEKAAPGVKVIGEAYIVGSNGGVDIDKWGMGKATPMLSLASNEDGRNNVTIQGIKIDKKYIVRQNMTNLFNTHNFSPVNGYRDNERINWPSDPDKLEYYENEGATLKMVAYDKDWVYIYSPGYATFEYPQTLNCYAWTLTLSHPAGFYKIDRDYVIIEQYKYREDAKGKIVAEGQIIVGGLKIHPIPGRVDTGSVGSYSNNEVVKLLSKTPVKSKTPEADGNTTYYKVARYELSGKPGTYRVGYLNSKYVNATTYKTLPKNYVRGKVARAKINYDIPVYSEKNSTKVTDYIYQVDAKIDINLAKSDSNWTAIAFNDGIGYLPAKYTKYLTSNVQINNIVNNQYVISWRKIPQKCRAVVVNKTNGKTIATVKNLTGNKVTIKDSYFKNTNNITVKITADYGDGEYDYKTINIAKPMKATLQTTYTSGNNYIYLTTSSNYKVQYADNSSFKNAKIISATTNKGQCTKIKNLKKNTTYYVRYAYFANVKTANGTKAIRGGWSPTHKIKTTNYKVHSVKLKSVTGQSKAVTAKWNKVTVKGGCVDAYEVMAATNKNFTKGKKSETIDANWGGGLKEWQLKGLKKKTKYYVRVRAVCDCETEPIYSKWSAVKSVKTK